jgi:VCBS repeat-containing protein
VSLAVVDPAPVGVPVSYTTRENVPLNVPVAQGVLASDIDSAGDPLTATLATTVSHGTLVLNSNGSFTYTPAASFTGTDSFTYVPHGTYVAGSPTKVTITIGQGAGPPPPPAPPAPPHVAVSHSTSIIAPAVASTAVSFKAATPVTPQAAAPISPTPPAPPPQAPSTRHASDSLAPVAALSPMVPPKAVTSNVDPYLNATGLLSVPDPIVLRDYISADDASFALMLPASPQIAQLPEAFALAAQRLAARPQAIITFVDPVTGQAADDAGPADQQDAPELAWLLLDADSDANMGAVASQIRWDSPTP